MERLIAWDRAVSQRCHVRGWRFELIFKLLEWSGHGLLWLAVAVVLVATTYPHIDKIDHFAARWLASLRDAAEAHQYLGPLWDNTAARSLSHVRLYNASTHLLFALLLDLVIVGAIKYLVKRERPTYNKRDMMATVSLDAFSFPSGHTTRTTTLTLLLPSLFPITPLGTYMLALWCILVAVSRITLGRHHLLDVVCGVLVGVFDAWLMFLVSVATSLS